MKNKKRTLGIAASLLFCAGMVFSLASCNKVAIWACKYDVSSVEPKDDDANIASVSIEKKDGGVIDFTTITATVDYHLTKDAQAEKTAISDNFVIYCESDDVENVKEDKGKAIKVDDYGTGVTSTAGGAFRSLGNVYATNVVKESDAITDGMNITDNDVVSSLDFDFSEAIKFALSKRETGAATWLGSTQTINEKYIYDYDSIDYVDLSFRLCKGYQLDGGDFSFKTSKTGYSATLSSKYDLTKLSDLGEIIIAGDNIAYVGTDIQLSTYVYPTHDVKWSSDHEDIATVDKDTGKVTPIKAGDVSISCATVKKTYDDITFKTAVKNITVKDDAVEKYEVSVLPTKVTGYTAGDSLDLTGLKLKSVMLSGKDGTEVVEYGETTKADFVIEPSVLAVDTKEVSVKYKDVVVGKVELADGAVVADNILASFDLVSKPTKLDYTDTKDETLETEDKYTDNKLVFDGLTVKEHYKYLTSEVISYADHKSDFKFYIGEKEVKDGDVVDAAADVKLVYKGKELAKAFSITYTVIPVVETPVEGSEQA